MIKQYINSNYAAHLRKTAEYLDCLIINISTVCNIPDLVPVNHVFSKKSLCILNQIANTIDDPFIDYVPTPNDIIPVDKVDDRVLSVLKKYGFMWLKDSCTDKVESKYIENIFRSANGFTVFYKDSELKYSTATISSIEYPQDFLSQWIEVNWLAIDDERIDSSK